MPQTRRKTDDSAGSTCRILRQDEVTLSVPLATGLCAGRRTGQTPPSGKDGDGVMAEPEPTPSTQVVSAGAAWPNMWRRDSQRRGHAPFAGRSLGHFVPNSARLPVSASRTPEPTRLDTDALNGNRLRCCTSLLAGDRASQAERSAQSHHACVRSATSAVVQAAAARGRSGWLGHSPMRASVFGG